MFAKPFFAAGLTALICSFLPQQGLLAADAEVSEDGLQLVEKSRGGSLYADPNVDWSSFTQIRLLDATVAFRRNWQRDQNRSDPFKVRTEDMENIKQDMAAMFIEVFSEELTRDGVYQISTESGESVLTIEPAIVDLDVAAPDTQRAGISRQYTESAGEMTLQLRLLDSVSGDLLAKSSDRREAPRRGYLQWTNSVTNQAEARRIMRRWAQDLRARLDQARSASPAASTEPDTEANTAPSTAPSTTPSTD